MEAAEKVDTKWTPTSRLAPIPAECDSGLLQDFSGEATTGVEPV